VSSAYFFQNHINDEDRTYPDEKQSKTAVKLKDCRVGDEIAFATGKAVWQILEHSPYYKSTTLDTGKGRCIQNNWDTLVYPVSYSGVPHSPRQTVEVVEVRDTKGKLLGVEIYLNGRMISPPFTKTNVEERYCHTRYSDVLD